MKSGRSADAGELQEGRREIHVQDHVLGVHAAGPKARGKSNEHGNPDGRLVHEPLVEQTMLAEKETVVRRVDDDGVVCETLLVQILQHPTDVLVHREKNPVVVPDELLKVAALALFTRQVR